MLLDCGRFGVFSYHERIITLDVVVPDGVAVTALGLGSGKSREEKDYISKRYLNETNL